MTQELTNITFSDRDEFNRKAIAEKIIKLLKSEIPISPFIIDGDWGIGKTEFCYKLIDLIKKQSNDSQHNDHATFHAIYIDAFKADHADEPLTTILAAILNSLPKSDDKVEFRKKAKNVLKFSSKVFSKAAVGFLLRQDAEGLPDEFDNAFKKIIDKSIDSVLKTHEKAEEKITVLKAVLAEITENDQLIIFIDELDRCRPDFTVKILENIKHIFDINGVQFVLIANSKQLHASIKHSYGDVNAKRYLDKFIGYSFHLPNIVYKKRQASNISIVHFHNLLAENKLLQQTDLAKEGYDRFFNILISVNQLSLREVETFIKHLMIFHTLAGYGLSSDSKFGVIMLRIFGIFIFCFKPKILEQLDLKIIDKKALNALINQKPDFDFDQRVKGYTHTKLISMVITTGALSQSELQEFKLDSKKSNWKYELHQFIGDFGAEVYKRPFDYMVEAIDEMKFATYYDD